MEVLPGKRALALLLVFSGLAACSTAPVFGPPVEQDLVANPSLAATKEVRDEATSTRIWDLFRASTGNDVGGNVNRYLWNASLDALSFLPVETVDPFSGVISTGYGTPPGGGRAYRATILISDPSLDARSLKVALQTRGGGPVSAETVRQVEDAILTRARQLRTRDSRF